jgi:hypothetical protein
MKVTPIEPGNRIQLPSEWVAEFGLRNLATLEKTAEGILVRRAPPLTWDEIYADKLPLGQPPAAAGPLEVTGDDLLF